MLIAAIIDAILVLIFMKFAHPWKGILSGDEKIEKANLSEVSADVVAKEVPEANGVSEANEAVPLLNEIPEPREVPEPYEIF